MAKRDVKPAVLPFTQKRGQYLAFIHTYTQLHGRAPAEADLQAHFGVTPPSVHQMILTLERKGLLSRRPGEARSIRVLVPPASLPPLERGAGRRRVLPPPPVRGWRFDPRLLKVPPGLKAEVEAAVGALLEELRPRWVSPPPASPEWNYPVDLFTRWQGRFFYIMVRYACPGPGAPAPSFEVGHARLEYAGADRFHLAYYRHTEQWGKVAEGLTLEECLQAVREYPVFRP